VPLGFQGELRCVQVDESGSPLRANKLKGSATLVRNSDVDASKYNAIAIPGNPDPSAGSSDHDLLFNWTAGNPQGEYAACPDTLTVNTLSEGMDDPIVIDLGDCLDPGDCPINTWLTFVPCSQDFERNRPGRSTVSINTYDEFESVLSTTITVDCWLNASLSAQNFQTIFNRQTLGVHARFTPIAGHGGILAVGEELRSDGSEDSTWAAFNVHFDGNRFDAARNIAGDLLPGRTCAGGSNAGAVCNDSAQCPGGSCVNGVLDTMVLPRW